MYIPPKLNNGKRWRNLKKAEVTSRIFRYGFFRRCLKMAIELSNYVAHYAGAYLQKSPILRFLKKNPATGLRYFDFCGAKLPDFRNKKDFLMMPYVFEDTFLVLCFYGDNHDKHIVEALDDYMDEGPYGYTDGSFDVTVKAGDVVIDAGAWVGDFSAYSAAKGARVFAFEPVSSTFQILTETAALAEAGAIVPVKKGLGKEAAQIPIYSNPSNSGANSVVIGTAGTPSETIDICTLDSFVAEHNLTRVDFIKADIEGAERDLLRGAAETLRKFAPKLALCTYHLTDDPQVLENLILEINPRYKVVHLRHKLFAAVDAN
jgi:FkbM family methyltransferase